MTAKKARYCLGYAFHRASVALHHAALFLLEWADDQRTEPGFWLLDDEYCRDIDLRLDILGTRERMP